MLNRYTEDFMGNEMIVSMTQDQLKDMIQQTVTDILKDLKLHNQADLDCKAFERDDYLTREEVGKILNIGHSTISSYIRDGILIKYKYISNQQLFKKSDISKTFPEIEFKY